MENKDQAKGKYEQVKGNLKKAAGAVTGDRRLKEEGAKDELTGSVREGIGNVKEAIDDTNDTVRDALRK